MRLSSLTTLLAVTTLAAACGKSEPAAKPAAPAAPVAAPAPKAAPAKADVFERTLDYKRVYPGMTAKEVKADLGLPVQELMATEGEACFNFEAMPFHEICFSIDAEQATWKQVLKKNHRVHTVKEVAEVAPGVSIEFAATVITWGDEHEPGIVRHTAKATCNERVVTVLESEREGGVVSLKLASTRGRTTIVMATRVASDGDHFEDFEEAALQWASCAVTKGS
jgi:hypothetical protein